MFFLFFFGHVAICEMYKGWVVGSVRWVEETGTGRIPLMGVRRRFHNARLGPGLALSVIDAVRTHAVSKGITSVEMSWVLENNEGMKTIVDILGGYQSKRYRVYDKKLDGS